MAEDEPLEQDQHEPGHTGNEQEVQDDETAGDDGTAEGATTGGGDQGGESEQTPGTRSDRLVMSADNARVVGRVVIHYPQRDVTVLVDGDAAMRLLWMYERQNFDLGDWLSPAFSSAENAWVVLDLEQPLAVSWYPGLGERRSRVALDPEVAA